MAEITLTNEERRLLVRRLDSAICDRQEAVRQSEGEQMPINLIAQSCLDSLFRVLCRAERSLLVFSFRPSQDRSGGGTLTIDDSGSAIMLSMLSLLASGSNNIRDRRAAGTSFECEGDESDDLAAHVLIRRISALY